MVLEVPIRLAARSINIVRLSRSSFALCEVCGLFKYFLHNSSRAQDVILSLLKIREKIGIVSFHSHFGIEICDFFSSCSNILLSKLALWAAINTFDFDLFEIHSISSLATTENSGESFTVAAVILWYLSRQILEPCQNRASG